VCRDSSARSNIETKVGLMKTSIWLNVINVLLLVLNAAMCGAVFMMNVKLREPRYWVIEQRDNEIVAVEIIGEDTLSNFRDLSCTIIETKSNEIVKIENLK